jgi:hypothetical protein
MSEEIHEEMAEILTEETQTTETAESSPASEEAPKEEAQEETLEERLERIEKENESLNRGRESMKKRIDKITAQKYDVEGKYKQELETYQQRLKEYTGEELTPQNEPVQNQSPTREQLKAEIRHEEEVEKLKANTEVMGLFQQRAEAQSNPFVNNPMIDQVVRNVGFPLDIVETILKDDDLCDDLSGTEDPYRITKLLTKAQVRHELANASKEDVPSKPKRIAKKPPAKPSGASGNRADVKNMSVEEYALRRRKRKFGI